MGARATILLVLGLTLAGFARPSLGDDTVQACFEAWPPYQVPTKGGDATGLAIEATRAALEDLGHMARFEALPYERCVRKVRAGERDMIVSSGAEPGLLVAWPHKVVWAIGFLVRNDHAMTRMSGLDDFKGWRIGVAQQFDFPSKVESFPNWTLEPNSNDLANLKKLALGRVDAVLTDVVWALSLADTDLRGARWVPPMLMAVPQPDAFRPGLEDLRDRYQTRLTEMINDGRLDDLYARDTGLSLREISEGALYASGEED